MFLCKNSLYRRTSMPQCKMKKNEGFFFTMLKLGMFSLFLLFILHLFTRYLEVWQDKSTIKLQIHSGHPVRVQHQDLVLMSNSRKTMDAVSKPGIQYLQIWGKQKIKNHILRTKSTFHYLSACFPASSIKTGKF